MLQRVQQCARHLRQVAGQKDRGAGDPNRPLRVQHLDELGQRHRVARALFGQHPAAAPPCSHDCENQRGDDDREPAAFDDFQHVGRQERQIDQREKREHRHRNGEAPAVGAHIEKGETRSDQHHAADRNPVRRTQIVG